MIYFDNAATTWKKPDGVMAAIARALGECGGNPGRSSHALSLSAAEGVDAVRCSLAALLGADDPSHIVFCHNATEALNMAILTRVQRGDHILISDREHNAVYRPVCRLLREGIADFDVFSTMGDVMQNIRSLLRKNTRMLLCNHVSNVDGAVAPIEAIGRLCRERGIYFIVDASQSLGHMPFSCKTICADAVCGPGHKGLFGIQGCGFVWLRQESGLREFHSGGSGSASRSPEMPPTLPERMEAGTLPTPAILALGAGLDFLHKTTPEAIAAHERMLADRLCDHLNDIRGIRLYRGASDSVLSFTAEQCSPDELTAALDDRHICVRGGLHCAPLSHSALGTIREGTVRVSFSYFNTKGEVDRFAKELTAILAL
ncbi:MAG: aminotransferase class V-fold PLP-dependent enzyme [Clostridia bacterium]|nr:aminotransferase class V-fold PLP-dependent enzyme [Clostridia bacterium]